MRKILQPGFKRGPVAQRAAIALLLGLITILFTSVLMGVHAL
jgi:hypothetical protein